MHRNLDSGKGAESWQRCDGVEALNHLGKPVHSESGSLDKALSHLAGAGLDLWRTFSTMIKISYAGYRFPPEIIQQAIWLYVRFTLSFRDVDDLLAERGIVASYETVRRWVNHFGPKIAADLRKRRPRPHTTWHLDEVYLKIDGRMVHLWRAVDAEGDFLDCWSKPGETSARRSN
jgi:hypothetical protein